MSTHSSKAVITQINRDKKMGRTLATATNVFSEEPLLGMVTYYHQKKQPCMAAKYVFQVYNEVWPNSFYKRCPVS